MVSNGACDSVSDHGQRVTSSWFRVGDLRDIKNAMENPSVPIGCILVRDALPKLADEQIPISHSGLLMLIKNKIVGGGKVPAFKSNFAPYKMWWMMWDQRSKIPVYEKPGTRLYWINRKDFYPAKEAKVEAAVSGGKLWRWTPIEHGGKGEICPALGRTIVCTVHAVRHRNGDKLLVYAGDDLRIIEAAEKKLTEPRPAPIPPPSIPGITPPGPSAAAQPESLAEWITIGEFCTVTAALPGTVSRGTATAGRIEHNGKSQKLRRLRSSSAMKWFLSRQPTPDPLFALFAHIFARKIIHITFSQNSRF